MLNSSSHIDSLFSSIGTDDNIQVTQLQLSVLDGLEAINGYCA